MTFTIQSVGTSATATGTNANDFGDFTGFLTLTLEAFEGDDRVSVSNTLTASSITMDSGNDFFFMGEDDGLVASSVKMGDGLDDFEADFLDIGTVVGGGKGADRLSVGGVGAASALKGGKGADEIFAFSNIESSTVAGGKGADTIGVFGNGDNSVVSGGNGADTIAVVFNSATGSGGVFGGAGDDTILAGGLGNVYGDDGNDVINASGTVYGGAGDDEIVLVDDVSEYFGGSGSDTFVVFAGDDDDKGVVRDFEVGTDLIDLTPTGLKAQNGGDALVFQDNTIAGPLGAGTTLYEIATDGANITTSLQSILGVATPLGSTAEIAVVSYAAGNAFISNVDLTVANTGIITVNSVELVAEFENVAAGALGAADFV